MPEKKPVYANYPERDLKVVIGPNINAATTKALRRLSIGTYEMSFTQQERAAATAEAARLAITHLAKAHDLTTGKGSHRDYVCVFTAENADMRYSTWVTTPFELTQSAHIVWAKFQELTGEMKVGIAFKLSTSFTDAEVETILKKAQDNAVVLEAGQPFTLKGNPPPRFAKKKPAAETPAAAEGDAQPAAEEKPAADAGQGAADAT